MNDPAKMLNRISKPPSRDEAFDEWLKMRDAIAFLHENVRQSEFVVYAANQSTFIHALLVPNSAVDPLKTDDLMGWNFNATSSWGINVVFSGSPSVSVSPPLGDTGTETLAKGEQIVFARRFDGRSDKKTYYEILQKFVHTFDIHWVEERSAYCRLDKRGDIEDVVRIIDLAEDGKWSSVIILFDREALDEYLVLTDAVIVRTFNFTRFRPSAFGGWHGASDENVHVDRKVFYRIHIESGHASYMRGFQLIRPCATKDSVLKRHDWRADSERQYETFIVHDWKNKTIREVSCAPGSTVNYFTKSALPWELSPAFFRPEVLLRYKADSEKYRMTGRSVSCRGAWSLRSFDINEAGQVHAYLVDLRGPPYEEQQYWKSFNEEPKASISKRALKADFEGSWDLGYDPLESLKAAMYELNIRSVEWWTLRSDQLPDQVHYPVTPSSDEWANEILQLDQFIVEGLEEKWLRNKALELGRSPDSVCRSVRLLEECLVGLGFTESDAKDIVSPLREVHDLRSKLKGHASGEEAVRIKKEIRKKHGSYVLHFRSLCERCDKSMRKIAETLKPSFAAPIKNCT